MREFDDCCTFAGRDFKLSCGAFDSVGDLRKKICIETNSSLPTVILYCGPCLLDNDTVMVADLLEFTDCFLLEPPEAGRIEFTTDKKLKDIRLVTGSSKKFKPPMRIQHTEKKKTIKADQNKFGIVTHEETDGSGRKVYTVERYQVEGEAKVKLRRHSETGEVLVFLEGENEPLGATIMTYVEKVKFYEKKHCSVAVCNPGPTDRIKLQAEIPNFELPFGILRRPIKTPI